MIDFKALPLLCLSLFRIGWDERTSTLLIPWCHFWSFESPKTLGYDLIFIGPESDHWECLSVTDSLTHWLTNCCLVNLINVALACEDANSKLVEIVTVADVDSEDHVGNSLLQIWELMFGPKTKTFFRLEHKGWSRFWSWSSARFWNWSLFSILPLMFCRGDEVESWSIFWS